MMTVPKKGISVKVSEDLYAEINEYIRNHDMTMTEFVTTALDNELHPKNEQKEGNNMANTRTVAFQVPEELFQRIKEYLHRNHMTQKQFLLSLIENELEREQSERERQNGGFEDEDEQDEDDPDLDENSATDDFEGGYDEDDLDSEAEDTEKIADEAVSAAETEEDYMDEPDGGDDDFNEDESDEEAEDDDFDEDEDEDESESYGEEDEDSEFDDDEDFDDDYDDEESEDEGYSMSM